MHYLGSSHRFRYLRES